MVEDCPGGVSGETVWPDPRFLEPAGNGSARNRQLCRGRLRSDGEMRGICELGVPPSRARMHIALIGDSHAAQWRPALDWIGKKRKLRIVSISASACDYIYGAGFKRSEGQKWLDCLAFRQEVPRYLARNRKLHSVVFSSVSRPEPANIAGYQEAWRRLPGSVRRIAVIRDNPRSRDEAHSCILDAVAAGDMPAEVCASPRAEALVKDSQFIAAQQAWDVDASGIDLSRLFCDWLSCYPVIGGVLVYHDGNHQTAQFNLTLAPYLLEELRAAWPRI